MSEVNVYGLAYQIAENFINGAKAEYSADKYIPKKIIRSGEVTVVFWQDDSKTIVRRDPEDEDSIHTAVCAALAKRIYGSNSQIKKVIEKAMVKTKSERFHEAIEKAIRKWKHKHGGQMPNDDEKREIYKEYLHLL